MERPPAKTSGAGNCVILTAEAAARFTPFAGQESAAKDDSVSFGSVSAITTFVLLHFARR